MSYRGPSSQVRPQPRKRDQKPKVSHSPSGSSHHSQQQHGHVGFAAASGRQHRAVSRPSDGLLVVSVIGDSEEELAELLDRLIGFPVFSSKNFEGNFASGAQKAFSREEWSTLAFQQYYDEANRIVYLMLPTEFEVNYAYPLHKGEKRSPVQNAIPIADASHKPTNADLEGMDIIGSKSVSGKLWSREEEVMLALQFVFNASHAVILVKDHPRLDSSLLIALRSLQRQKESIFPQPKDKLPILSSPGSSLSHQSPSTSRAASRSSGHQNGIQIRTLSEEEKSKTSEFTPALFFVFLENVPSSEQREKSVSVLDSEIRRKLKKSQLGIIPEPGFKGFQDPSSSLFYLDASQVVAIIDKERLKAGSAARAISLRLDEVFSKSQTCSFHPFEALKPPPKHDSSELEPVKEFLKKKAGSVRSSMTLAAWTATCNSLIERLCGGGVGPAAMDSKAEASSPSLQLTLPDGSLNPEMEKKGGILKVPGFFLREESIGDAPLSSETSATPKLLTLNYLDAQFSIDWCEKVYPTAWETYVRDLPDSWYTSAVHVIQKEAALGGLASSAKGPAVQHFMLKLAEQCESYWKAGRQQCEEKSLTGRACVGQRGSHGRHSSAVGFKRACLCGKVQNVSRDPFEVQDLWWGIHGFRDCCEAAMVKILPLSFCVEAEQREEKLPVAPLALLPAAGQKRVIHGIHFENAGWVLVKFGDSAWYDPVKGLSFPGMVHSGTHGRSFLSKWEVPVPTKRALKPLNTQRKYQALSKALQQQPAQAEAGRASSDTAQTGPSLQAEEFPALPTAQGFTREEFPPLMAKPSARNIPEPPQRGAETETITLFIGVEHECPQGHRYLFQGSRSGDKVAGGDKRQKGKSAGDRPGAEIAGGKIPVFFKCPACARSSSSTKADTGGLQEDNLEGDLAQIMRLFIVTPAHPVKFATCPAVEFRVSQGVRHAPSHRFGFPFEMTLPSDSSLCLHFPQLYTAKNSAGQLEALHCFPSSPESSAFTLPWTLVRVAAEQDFVP